MIEIKDLKKGLRVVGKNFKGIIVGWDIQKPFIIPQLTLQAIITKTYSSCTIKILMNTGSIVFMRVIKKYNYLGSYP